MLLRWLNNVNRYLEGKNTNLTKLSFTKRTEQEQYIMEGVYHCHTDSSSSETGIPN